MAQTSRDSESTSKKGNSRSIFSSKKVAAKKAFTYDDQKIKEYEALMKENKKKYAKMAKEMEKPQYSDPTYFGHKKKPKKRKPGKRKLCEECGIVH